MASPPRTYTFGDFARIERIGVGSTSFVFKCRDLVDGNKVVAVKQINFDGPNPSRRHAMFSNEESIQKSLNHENIVKVLGSFVCYPTGFLVMELAELDLKMYIFLRHGGIEVDDAKDKGKQLLQAIKFCHDKKILHRDIKPKNVVVTEGGVIKLTDFGLARNMILRPNQQMTAEVVTENYRAPEVIVGEGAYCFPIDIWSFACCFAEMLSGTMLFPSRGPILILCDVVNVLGTPKDTELPKFATTILGKALILQERAPTTTLVELIPKLETTPLALQVLDAILKYVAAERPSAQQLLDFDFFK